MHLDAPPGPAAQLGEVAQVGAAGEQPLPAAGPGAAAEQRDQQPDGGQREEPGGQVHQRPDRLPGEQQRHGTGAEHQRHHRDQHRPAAPRRRGQLRRRIEHQFAGWVFRLGPPHRPGAHNGAHGETC
ncbi:hypothetical protein [Dactylosporangium darangshiense]|uniref:hypothetical protein n=1 Tax=Dactylosporangium darangshiense TaxID=579108 RepID=UPI00362EC020